ncbi:type IV pilin N-terminal domain-containing protein [Methanococcoides methylutens]|uniref:type IV pilin N-terminal domain-containing protein n=1 Tax=Methanococcoides methylutens TaxID=2226 RepID=UPI000693D0FF|nr:type IV pilin N-terminal domain-containing protein [Methanococcoides methylutens]
MIRKMNIISDSRAVSPVIGVMLMVVVTVVLAAAVSSSSQGILDGVEQAPSAVFSVEIVKNINSNMGSSGNMSYMSIRHISGDSIDTADIKIVTINPQARGDTKMMEILPNVNNTHTPFYTGAMPMWNRGDLINDDSEGIFFGDYTLEPGSSMLADEYSNYNPDAKWVPDEGKYENADADEINPENDRITGMQAMFADWYSLESGDYVNVKIVHNPSQKVIFDSDVRVI